MISGGWGYICKPSGTPPNETITNGVPVGAAPGFGIFANGWTVDPKTVAWSGGTDDRSYFSDPATARPAPSMQLTKGVPTNGSYSFIVDADPRQYNISVSCAYYIDPSDPSKGDTSTVTSNLTFTSVRPSTASLTATAGSVTFTVGGGDATFAYNPAIGFTATTTTANFAGNLMLMQLDTTHWSRRDNNGVSTHESSHGPAPSFDDGDSTDKFPIGMDLDQGGYGWWLAANGASATKTTSDDPELSVASNWQYLSVSDNFQTYLMYMPTGPRQETFSAVWVALAQVSWSWSGSATNNPWPNNSSNPAPTPQNVTPGGDAAFPAWSDRTSDLTWQPGP
jgi:hypothetical protein